MTLRRLTCFAALCLTCCGNGPPAGETTQAEKSRPSLDLPSITSALEVIVRDGDDLLPMPSRVIINPIWPTKMPDFRSAGDTATLLFPGVLGVPEGVMLLSGQGFIPVPQGRYNLMILQGPEYEAIQREVIVGKKQIVNVDVTLSHSVRTGGWLAADMHIHSAVSYDSQLLPLHRVVSEVVSGVSVLVPTEHSFNYDLSDEIYQLGYQQRAVSIPGGEYGFAEGHAGVYPVLFDKRNFVGNKDYGGGAPSWQHYPEWLGYPAETAFPAIHALLGEPLVIVNHPRLAPDLGYFLNIGWPHSPGEVLGTASLFDGMEVMNGYEDDPAATTQLLADWFFLLNGGYRITGLGNSDTHRLDRLRAGYPRTWLRLATDDASRVLPSDLKDALLAMRAVASNGPFVNLWVDGHELGDTVVPAGGTVRARVTADAPGWIDINKVLLYLNGSLIQEIPITQRSHPALYQEVSVPVTGDGWLVAMVVGDTPLSADVIGYAEGGVARPFAFTNPVWLDADGDGKITIPKGPPPAPAPFGVVPAPPMDQARIFTTPMHAPLDCDPATWPSWLK